MTSDPVMINPEQQRFVLMAIINGPRPRTTLRVCGVVMAHIQRDTGEVTASCRELAEDASATSDETARALNRLAAIGALLKREPGRYAINPHVGWVGDPATRQKAAKHVPPMRLVDPVV
jgi:DNA-binding IclR family transcriptional regulator